jgi:hypothetical protein
MRKSVAYTFLFWLLIIDLASAGDYVLVLGKGFEVCEAYLKNLNSFPNHPPMVCDRPLNLKLPEFQKPEWKPLDIRKTIELLKDMSRYADRGRTKNFDAEHEKWLPGMLTAIEAGRLRFSLTRLDVNKDGIAENILRQEGLPCDYKNQSNFMGPSGPQFYVLTEDTNKVDATKTQMIQRLIGQEMFLYKGVMHIDGWGGKSDFRDGEILVFNPTIEGFAHRCTYHHVPSRRK